MSYADNGRVAVIYVRGFAGGGSAINNAVDDPFYGFSQGSVHVRGDSGGSARFHQFESPMMRLSSASWSSKLASPNFCIDRSRLV